MSGTMQFRSNRYWVNAVQVNVAAFRFFWEFLQFVKDHPNLDFVAYGTGASQLGTDPTTAWDSWASPPPMSDNSWFVFKATLASEDLSGSGTRQWQAKVQVYNSASGGGFDDPSGNDYGREGTYQIVCLRFSPDGGWAGPGTLDFSPGSGSSPSSNWGIYYGYAIDFGVHFVGDDDTIAAVGWGWTSATPPSRLLPRGFSIGETARIRTSVTKPEFGLFGRISADDQYGGTGTYYKFPFARGGTYSAFVPNGVIYWPSYSLAPNGTSKIEGEQKHRNFGYDSGTLHTLPPDPWTDNVEMAGLLIGQFSPPESSNFGRLRLFRGCHGSNDCGTVLADGTWLQIATSLYVQTYGGLAVPWSSGVDPAW